MSDDNYLDDECFNCPNQAIEQHDYDIDMCRDCYDEEKAWDRADDERQRRREAC